MSRKRHKAQDNPKRMHRLGTNVQQKSRGPVANQVYLKNCHKMAHVYIPERLPKYTLKYTLMVIIP